MLSIIEEEIIWRKKVVEDLKMLRDEQYKMKAYLFSLTLACVVLAVVVGVYAF